MSKLLIGLAALLLMSASTLVRAGTVTYVYSDPQGTPLAEADASGNVTATFDYRPYGVQALGAPKDGPGYTGHVNEADNGLVYMQARYYDPWVGRFLSVDPVAPSMGAPFSFNRYVYVDDNPLTNLDPTGGSCYFGATSGDHMQGCSDGDSGGVSPRSAHQGVYAPITQAERIAAKDGNFVEYWTLRYNGSPRDPWATTALALWHPEGLDNSFLSSEQRVLAIVNLARLNDAIAYEHGESLVLYDSSTHSQELRQVGIGIMQGYVTQIDANDGYVPTLTQGADIHYNVFVRQLHMSSGVYGGTPFGHSEDAGPLRERGVWQAHTLNLMFNYCPGCIQ